MTGIQNIIHRLKSGEIIELSSHNQDNRCLQYSMEDNAFIVFNEQFRSFILEEKEIVTILRNHIQGDDVMNK